MNPKIKKIILGSSILILVSLLGYFVYKQFNGGIAAPTMQSSNSTLKSTITDEPINPVIAVTTSTNTAITDEIVEQLKKVSTITLSTTLVNSSSFSNLIDLSTALPDDTSTGRRNPFMVK